MAYSMFVLLYRYVLCFCFGVGLNPFRRVKLSGVYTTATMEARGEGGGGGGERERLLYENDSIARNEI